MRGGLIDGSSITNRALQNDYAYTTKIQLLIQARQEIVRGGENVSTCISPVRCMRIREEPFAG